MKSITETIELKENIGVLQPKDPYSFAKNIEANQEYNNLDTRHTILFNKNRYFETTIYNKEVLKEISELTGIPIIYNNIIVAPWYKLEDFVISMNCLGILVKIDIDWI